MSLIDLMDADGNGRANINTGNKSSESVTISLNFGFGVTPSKQDFKEFDKNDGGVLSLHLGANKKVGGTDTDSNPDANEFRELTGGFLNVSWKNNEIQDLLDELIEGDGIDGVDLTFNSASSITLALDNGHATDFINLEGQYIEEYLASTPNGFDLFNKKDQVKVFCFDDPNKQEQIFSGRSDRLDNSEGAVGELFTSEINFLTEKGGELKNIVNAALEEKLGISDTKDLKYVNDDGESLVVEVTNLTGATDTLILKGSDVEALISDFTSGGVNVGNKFVNNAVRDYTDPSTSDNVSLGANNNTSDVDGTPPTNELRAVTGGSMSKSDAEQLLLNLLEDDGFQFSEGQIGTWAYTELATFEADLVQFTIVNRSDTSLVDTISLANDWDAFVDAQLGDGSFDSLKTEYDTVA